jgi:RNA polymerase sigma-70 factor (ECF subfamily)
MRSSGKISTSQSADWDALTKAARAEARRCLTSRHDAEDAAQEAVVRAWRNLDRCRLADTRPWVRQIARREALRLIARRRAAEDRELRAAPTAAIVSDEVERADLRTDLQRALADLPESDRALLVARYALDLTQPDAAALLGMPEGTAKVRLHRMRRKLATAL